MDDQLIETLRDAQRLGFLGRRPVEQAAEHAHGFVEAIGEPPAGARIIDLGSGGGLPGLVLADAYPECAITLVDRRGKRTDFLRRAVRRLGWGHVSVMQADVDDLVRLVRSDDLDRYDVVTARGFGPPEVTLGFAVALVTPEGRIVISEPPEGDRWDPDLLASVGRHRVRRGPVGVFDPVD
mgnify:FL=1